jgi:hypothetical protein
VTLQEQIAALPEWNTLTPADRYVASLVALQAALARLALARELLADINAEAGYGDLTSELRDRMDALLPALEPPK